LILLSTRIKKQRTMKYNYTTGSNIFEVETIEVPPFVGLFIDRGAFTVMRESALPSMGPYLIAI